MEENGRRKRSVRTLTAENLFSHLPHPRRVRRICFADCHLKAFEVIEAELIVEMQDLAHGIWIGDRRKGNRG
jgi:hypothetical protein